MEVVEEQECQKDRWRKRKKRRQEEVPVAGAGGAVEGLSLGCQVGGCEGRRMVGERDGQEQLARLGAPLSPAQPAGCCVRRPWAKEDGAAKGGRKEA